MDWKQQEKQNREGILTFLWEEGFATAEQIKKHVFSQNTEKTFSHRKKLAKLEHRGLVGRKDVLFSQSGVYYLTGTGWNSIDNPDVHRISPTDRDKISNANGPHRLKIIDARLEIEKLIPIETWYSERTVTLYPQHLPRKPDFLFISKGKKIAGEVELTYRNSRKTKQIIAYWVYALQKHLVDQVLFLADTAAKTERLKQIIKNQKDEFIQIPLARVLFNKKEYRQEKVLATEEELNKIHVAQLGSLNQQME